jgi:hypothetical protein
VVTLPLEVITQMWPTIMTLVAKDVMEEIEILQHILHHQQHEKLKAIFNFSHLLGNQMEARNKSKGKIYRTK